MRRSTMAAVAATAAVIVAALIAWPARTRAGQPDGKTDHPVSPMSPPTTLVVPVASYQAIVISARGSTPEARQRNAVVPFTLRTRDATGVIADFPIFVPAGGTVEIVFPEVWRPSTASALYSPGGDLFAAWGVTAGPPGAGGNVLRFEPVERDPHRDIENRRREREFEEFLREVERNRTPR